MGVCFFTVAMRLIYTVGPAGRTDPFSPYAAPLRRKRGDAVTDTTFFARAAGSLIHLGMNINGEELVAEMLSPGASRAAAELLVSAKVAYANTGKPLPRDLMKLNWPVVRPDTVSVISSHGVEDDHQNRKILLFGFGDCLIGLSLPHEDLKQLVQVIQLALGPESGIPQ